MKPAEAYPVEVWMRLVGDDVNQARDVANCEKAITDAMVRAGVLVDDSVKYVAGNHQQYRKGTGPQRMVVWLEPSQD